MISNQVLYEITEIAEDGDFPIQRNTREVDVNSDITVKFTAGPSTNNDTPDSAWMHLNAVLSNVEKVLAARVKLRKDIAVCNLSDSNEVDQLQNNIGKFDKMATEARRQWRKELGLDKNSFDAIIEGTFDGKENQLLPYANLARWIGRELERLNDRITRSIDSNSISVTVQAFHSSFGGMRSALHVEGYDAIPAGALEPVDRTGLRLTPAEKARLDMEIAMSEQAAASIRKIKMSRDEMQLLYGTIYGQMTAVLDSIKISLELTKTGYVSISEALQPIAEKGKLNRNQTEAIARISDYLVLFQKDAAAIVAAIQQIRNMFGPGSRPDMTTLLSGKQTIMNYLPLFDSLYAWPTRWEKLRNDFAVLQSVLPAEQPGNLLPDTLTESISLLSAHYTEFNAMVKGFSRVFKSNDIDVDNAAATLAETDLPSIWLNFNNLVDGRIELSRAGLVSGDEIVIKIISKIPATADSPEKPFKIDTYKFTAVLMNGHREFGASLIFARGFDAHGATGGWEPCVAAHVNWLYHPRKSRKLYNWITPGFGFHLAYLSQGDRNVEFGIGANATLFQKILSGGIGYNLFNDNMYGFVGLSLFGLMDEAKSLTK